VNLRATILLQIYRHVLQAVAGHYLQAAGFDPAHAATSRAYLTATIEPFLRNARTQQLRQALLDLAGCLDATAEDCDTAAAASIPADLPEDVWDVGIGVSTAIGLYRRAVRVLAVHVLYFVWEGLGIGGPSPRPAPSDRHRHRGRPPELTRPPHAGPLPARQPCTAALLDPLRAGAATRPPAHTLIVRQITTSTLQR